MVLVRRLATADVVRNGVLAPIPPFVLAAVLWLTDHEVPAGLAYAASLATALAVAVFWARRSGAGRGVVVVRLPAHPAWIDDPDGDSAAAALAVHDQLAHRLVAAVVGGGGGHFDGERLTRRGVDLFFVGRDPDRVADQLRRALRDVGVEAPVTVS